LIFSVVFYRHKACSIALKVNDSLEGKPMKTRFLTILALLLMTLLLAACPPTPITQTPQLMQVTQIEDIVNPTLQENAALDQEIDYSAVPPGTVFFRNEDGTLTSTRIVPELSQPEWNEKDYPKGFSTTLVAGHWKKFLLGPVSAEQGYLVDATPQEASVEGAEVVSLVRPEFDGESWVDVLWLFQPKEAPPLPVYVQVYTTDGWKVVYDDRVSLEPGDRFSYPIGPASERGGFVAEVVPHGKGGQGDMVQSLMINPEFEGDWQDMLRFQLSPQNQAPMLAEIVIYQAPQAFLKSELTPRLEAGKPFTGILGLSKEQAVYVVEVTPLSEIDNQVETYSVEPVFMDGAWRDVLRVTIPAGNPAMDVNLRVYAVGPNSRLENVQVIPTITPNLAETELAAINRATATPTPTKPIILPSVTPKPSPTATLLAGCPGALPSRLQVGQTGFVSQEPPVANRVRSEPDREAEILGQIMPGEKFTVLDGPRCADGWAWWRLRSRAQDLEGWTSEGDTEYWLVPSQLTTEDGEEKGTLSLTAEGIDSADDIEAVIKRATKDGTQPGTVILDGKKGPFVLTGADRSINIFVSNLTLLGVNEAVIERCADGLFFDNLPNFPPKNILVEGIEFDCDNSGVVASGAYENVTLQNNIFRAGNSGIDIGGASWDWLIKKNLVEAAHPAIVVTGAQKIMIEDNTITGETGVTLRRCTQNHVQKNLIQASFQGVSLAQESWKNLVQANTIRGVSQAGITLEAGVTANQIVGNEVTCATGASCVKVDASPEVAKLNTISPVSEEQLLYSNDFESSAGYEWSHHPIEIAPNGMKFLGQFGNETVTLRLTSLPDHTEVRVVFEVYILRSWDGNVNPDIWEFKVDGKSLLLTTFDNQDFYSDHAQAYPGNYPKSSRPPRTGAKENNTLGYKFSGRPMDAVYEFSFAIPHSSPTLELSFSAKGLMADLADESWGIDNVAVYTIK
jgi:hypothetical protein